MLAILLLPPAALPARASRALIRSQAPMARNIPSPSILAPVMARSRSILSECQFVMARAAGYLAEASFPRLPAGSGLPGGSFLPPVTYATSAGPGGATIGDLNGDGKPDLVVAD